MGFWQRMAHGFKITVGSWFAYVALSDPVYTSCFQHPMITCFRDLSVEPLSRFFALLGFLLLSSALWHYLRRCGTTDFLGLDGNCFSAFDREHLHLGIQSCNSCPIHLSESDSEYRQLSPDFAATKSAEDDR